MAGKPQDPLRRLQRFRCVGETPDACTTWAGGIDKDGYARFWYDGRTQPASRVLWLLTKGAIPDGLIVRHSCDNPPCLNAAHLLLGTPKQNTQDALERKRMCGPRKVRAERKATINDLRAQGWPLQEIAEYVGLSRSSLYTYLDASLLRKGDYASGPRHANWIDGRKTRKRTAETIGSRA